VRVQVARKEGHAPEGHEWSTAVVATDAAAQDGRAQTTKAPPSRTLDAGQGRSRGPCTAPLDPLEASHQAARVMGPVLVCVRADPTAPHVLIRYRPTY
jgi:hypothetical protein